MLRARYEEKEKMLGADAMRYHERMLMLSVLDQLWKEHLLNMDHLKEGIGLRGYGQKDPLVEYKRESCEMFEEMNRAIEVNHVKPLVDKVFPFDKAVDAFRCQAEGDFVGKVVITV